MKISGGLIGEISGSFGGITGSHNRGGQYLRRRAIPTNPNSTRQQAVRSAFGGLVQAFASTLTDGQREGWREFATYTPRTNSLGEPLVLTAQQAFISCNTPRLQAGLTMVADAPLENTTGAGVLNTTPMEFLAGALQVSGDMADAAGDDGDLLLYWGIHQNASRKFYKGPYQLAAVKPIAADATQYNLSVTDTTDPDEWFAASQPFVGAFQPIKIVVCYDDGRYTQIFEEIVPIISGS